MSAVDLTVAELALMSCHWCVCAIGDGGLLVVCRLKTYRWLSVTCQVANNHGKMLSTITQLLINKKLYKHCEYIETSPVLLNGDLVVKLT